MIIKTQAIALQIRPWSQTSHMVTWLTPAYGKIQTRVKGACRPKSAFLGQYDLLYTCELLFYRQEHDAVHAIRECSPLKIRAPLRQNWRHCATAIYLADLTARVTVGHHEAHQIYALLENTLDLLADPTPADPRTLLLWYETQLLSHLGIMPDLTTCDVCHPPGQPWLRFSLPAGGFTCHHRPPTTGTHPASIAIHKDVRNLLQTLQNASVFPLFTAPIPSPAAQNNTTCVNLLLGISRFLGIFMSFHLDVPPAIRRVTWQMLNTTPAQ